MHTKGPTVGVVGSKFAHNTPQIAAAAKQLFALLEAGHASFNLLPDSNDPLTGPLLTSPNPVTCIFRDEAAKKQGPPDGGSRRSRVASTYTTLESGVIVKGIQCRVLVVESSAFLIFPGFAYVMTLVAECLEHCLGAAALAKAGQPVSVKRLALVGWSEMQIASLRCLWWPKGNFPDCVQFFTVDQVQAAADFLLTPQPVAAAVPKPLTLDVQAPGAPGGGLLIE
jgi:hypothetical protein